MSAGGNIAPQTMIGPYKVIRRIGAGGMGVVYEAFDAQKNRKIALKILNPNSLVNDNAIERFQAEGRALSQLDHPGIVTLYEILEHEGRYVLVMEYLDGQSLDDYILRHPQGMIDLIELLRQIAFALDAAHAAGIIHRDLKPANILLATSVDPAGNYHRGIKLIDFGVSKIQHDQDSPQTATDIVLGTANYIAPEVLLGAEASPSTDLYSMGLIFWQLLTGRTPFEGRTNVDVVRRIMNESLELPLRLETLLSPALQSLFRKMTSRDPRQRFRDVAEFLVDLDALSLDSMPEPLRSPIAAQIAVKNHGEIRSRLKLQGFEPLEVGFIMKLALEEPGGELESMVVTPQTQSDDFPAAIIREPVLAKAIEKYKSLRQAGRVEPIPQPQPSGSPSATRSAAPTPSPFHDSTSQWNVAGPWILLVVVVCFSLTILARATMKLVQGVKTEVVAQAPRVTGANLPPLAAPFVAPKLGDAMTLKVTLVSPEGVRDHGFEFWRVLSVSGDRVVWESDKGISRLTYTYPFVGIIRALNADGSPVKSGTIDVAEEEIEGDFTRIFPLQVGAEVNYRRVQKLVDKAQADRRVESKCRVSAREIVSIDLGNFDTFRVECESTDGAGKTNRVYSYAPLLRTWIRREGDETLPDGRRVRKESEVVAVRWVDGLAMKTVNAPRSPAGFFRSVTE